MRLSITVTAASAGFVLIWLALDLSSVPMGIVGGVLFGSGVAAGVL